MSDVFVSYASTDRDRVVPIVEAIERRGWTVWWDRKIGAGAAFDREIEKAIDEASCVVVVWSAASLESDWVRNEATEGLERGILVPVLIDLVRPPLAFRRTQTIDLTEAGSSEVLLQAIVDLCPVPTGSGRSMTPLVGREAEFDALQALVRQTKSGRGGFVLISGEAGVGKTRLTEEATSTAEASGMRVLTGRCESAGAAPYQPLLEQVEQAMRQLPGKSFRDAMGENAPELAQLVPDLRQRYPDIPESVTLPPDQARRYLLRGCAEFLGRTAGVQGAVLVFEDLHWAGESTCRLLRYLAERVREISLLLVGTYRDTDLESTAPFARILPELVKERLVDEIPLGRLDRDQVAALLEGRSRQSPPADLVALVFEATEGNPFFVEEMYRHLDESNRLFRADGHFASAVDIPVAEVPKGVRLTIEHRIAEVSEPCRLLLSAAAVKGRVVAFDFLDRMSDLSVDALVDALEEATRAALLEDVSVGRQARYQFVHELTRQTLIGSLSLPRRQRIHLQIADVVADLTRDENDAAEIAFHLYQAGVAAGVDRTSHFLLLASQQALDAVAFEDALRFLDMAEEVAEAAVPASDAQIQFMRGLAHRGAGHVEEALDALGEGIARGETFVGLLRQRAGLLIDLYRGDDALPDLERLLRIAQQDGNAALELEAQRLLADAYYRISLDNPQYATKALEACERTIELARAAGDRRQLANSLILSADFVDYWADHREQAGRNLEEAQAIADSLKDEALALDCATMELRVSAVTPMEFGSRAEEVLRRLEARRDPIRLKEHLFCMIHPARNAGFLERSVEICDRAIEIAGQLGVPPVQYPTLKAEALTALGRFDEAWVSLGREVSGDGYRFASALQRYGYLRFKAHMQDTAAVLAEAEALLAECRALNRIWMVEFIVDVVAIVGARGGAVDEAMSLLQRVEPDVGPRRRAAAEVELARGNAAEALAQVQDVVGFFETGGMRSLAAEADEVAIRCLLALSRWEDARLIADRQIEFCRSSGYDSLLWHLLAGRSRARRYLGDAEGASGDRRSARALLAQLAARVPTRELEKTFLAQPLALELAEDNSLA